MKVFFLFVYKRKGEKMKNLKVRTKLIVMNVVVIVMVALASVLAINGMIQLKNGAIDKLEAQTRADYDTEIKNQVDNALTVLDYFEQQYEQGEYSLEEAKTQAADALRNLRYGENGYFWADQTDGTNVVLLGSKTEGTNRLDAQDANGYHMVQAIIEVGQQEDGGYANYVFPREGETEALPKRSYSKLYKPFGWVVGTGNYTDYIDEIIVAEQDELNQQLVSSIQVMMVIVLVLLVVLLVISIGIIKDITSSLKKVVAFAGKLAEGNFTVRARKQQMKRKDEFGILAVSMNQLAIQLNDLLGQIQSESKGIGCVVENINQAVDTLNGEIEGVSATTEELSAGMQETAASAEEINDMSIQIEEVSKNIAQRAQDGAGKAEAIHNRAKLAKETTEKSYQSTVTMQQEMNVRLSKALEEAKVVSQIEVLAGTIMDITEQTNLLSLNASIEAARAGEAGKGFAVVAGEIRNLAQESRNAVESIKQITGAVTAAVENLSRDAESMLHYVSVDLTDTFKQFLDVTYKYNGDAAYVDDLVSDFSAISEELLASIDSVMQAIEGVSKASTEGALGITDIAEKSSNVTMMSSNVRDEIVDTGCAVDRLLEQVDKFIITNDKGVNE